MNLRVLITGAGAPGAYGIIKSLKSSFHVSYIIGTDIKLLVASIELLDEFITGKKSTDSDFITNLVDTARKNKIDIIIPLVTSELILLANHKSEFLKLGIRVLVMDENIIDIANNKLKMLDALKKNNIRIPRYQAFSNLSEFNEALTLFDKDQITCFKPSMSNGSRGFRIIDPNHDALNFLLNEKPNQAYISKANFEDLISNNTITEMVLMEYLPGDEYSVDIFKNETLEIIVPRRRVAMNSGISVEIIVEKSDEIVSYSREIINALNLNGVFGIQLKYGADGIPYILEINPRLQGTVIASVAAGANLPLIALESEFGVNHVMPTIRWGLRMIRRWEETYFDA